LNFELISDYYPTGDQPSAIEALVRGVKANEKHQILLGVTGSGKTFTMANIIQQVQKPTLVLTHNKTLVAQLYGEFKQLFEEKFLEFHNSVNGKSLMITDNWSMFKIPLFYQLFLTFFALFRNSSLILSNSVLKLIPTPCVAEFWSMIGLLLVLPNAFICKLPSGLSL